MARAVKQKKRRKELIAGCVALSGILAALILVALVLFQGQTPEQAAKPELPPLPTLAQRLENPYRPEQYQWDGERMTLENGEGIAGIDVSRYQDQVDWQKVADSGMEFAIVRIGYRTYGGGIITPDPNAKANYQGAKKAGLKVGVYFFSQAISIGEAMEEAQWVMDALEGWELDLPVVFDWELPADNPRTQDVTAGELTAYTRVFKRILENNGYDVMLYFNRHLSTNRLKMHRLLDMPHWLAMYSSEMAYPYDFDMWQYSDTGHVPGIQGDVDLNILLPDSEIWGNP